MDKFTIRGIIYIFISLIGLGYEVFFAEQVRAIPVIGFSCVIGIGLYCIFGLREPQT